MRQVRTVKELKSPARDLPADLVLTVGVQIGADVADDLIRRGYAVEHQEAEGGDKITEKQKKPGGRKRGEG